MNNKTLDILLLSGTLAASSILFSCAPKQIVLNPSPTTPYESMSVDEMLNRDPFKDAKIGGENSQLLKQIHDDPYQRKPIEQALNEGVSPDNIYNAIGWGIIQLQKINEKNIEEFHKSGKNEIGKDGSVVDEFSNMLWKVAHYDHILSELKNRYYNSGKPHDASGALQYWIERVVSLN